MIQRAIRRIPNLRIFVEKQPEIRECLPAAREHAEFASACENHVLFPQAGNAESCPADIPNEPGRQPYDGSENQYSWKVTHRDESSSNPGR